MTDVSQAALLGEAIMTVEGRDYRLKMEQGALIALEAKTNMSVDYLPAMIAGGKFTHARLILWAALREHHPELDEDAAGLLVIRLGLQGAFAKLKEAVQVAFPKVKPDPQA